MDSPHFMNENSCTERLSAWPKVTEEIAEPEFQPMCTPKPVIFPVRPYAHIQTNHVASQHFSPVAFLSLTAYKPLSTEAFSTFGTG